MRDLFEEAQKDAQGTVQLVCAGDICRGSIMPHKVHYKEQTKKYPHKDTASFQCTGCHSRTRKYRFQEY